MFLPFLNLSLPNKNVSFTLKNQLWKIWIWNLKYLWVSLVSFRWCCVVVGSFSMLCLGLGGCGWFWVIVAGFTWFLVDVQAFQWIFCMHTINCLYKGFFTNNTRNSLPALGLPGELYNFFNFCNYIFFNVSYNDM